MNEFERDIAERLKWAFLMELDNEVQKYVRIMRDLEDRRTDFEKVLCQIHSYPCYMCKFKRCVQVKYRSVKDAFY